MENTANDNKFEKHCLKLKHIIKLFEIFISFFVSCICVPIQFENYKSLKILKSAFFVKNVCRM